MKNQNNDLHSKQKGKVMSENYQLKSLEQQLKEFKGLFLSAPEDQIDDSLKERIKEWDKIPKAIEILQILDYASVHALASDFAISIFQIALKVALENEQITIQDLLPQAWWRD